MPAPEPSPTLAGAPLRERLRHGLTVATTAFLVLLIPVVVFLAGLGAAAGWWFGTGVARSAMQAPAFGLIALAIGWLFVILRAIFRPDLIRRPTPPA